MHPGIQVSSREHVEEVRVLQSDKSTGGGMGVREHVQVRGGRVTACLWSCWSACPVSHVDAGTCTNVALPLSTCASLQNAEAPNSALRGHIPTLGSQGTPLTWLASNSKGWGHCLGPDQKRVPSSST